MLSKSKEFDLIQDEVNFLTKSKFRLNILTCLYQSNLTIKEIVEKTKINYNSTISNLNKLESMGYIRKYKEKYYLKSSTKIKIINFIYLNNITTFLKSQREFFNNHYIQNKKLQALKELPLVEDYEIVSADVLNPYKVTKLYKDRYMNSKSLKMICTYVHPNCDEIITKLFTNKIPFEVVLTNGIHDIIKDKFIKHPNFQDASDAIKLNKVDNDIKLSLILTEKEVIIGLFRKDQEIFDKNSCLILKDESSIEWANLLFNEFVLMSEQSII